MQAINKNTNEIYSIPVRGPFIESLIADYKDPAICLEVPQVLQNKPIKVVDGVVVLDTVTKKSQEVQSAKEVRDKAYSNITNSIILDQLAITEQEEILKNKITVLDTDLVNNTITQDEYNKQKAEAQTIYDNLKNILNARISAKAVLFATAKSNFYTTTGLTEPTITA